MEESLFNRVRHILAKMPIVSKLRKRNEITPCELLQKEGLNSMSAFFRVGERLGVEFNPMFGTLLGIYREHAFIPHDDDVDMVCDIECFDNKLISALRDEGFVIERIFVASDRVGVQLPMKYHGLTSDIYFMYKDAISDKRHIFIPLAFEGKDWMDSQRINIFSVKDITIPYTINRISTPFLDDEIKILANSGEILKALYGDGFLIPKANAHANPPVRYYDLGEKYYSCYPIDIFENNNIIDFINKVPIKG